MNAEGLANTHGSVGSKFDKRGERVDIRLQAYALMQRCRTTDAFINGLSQAPLTGKGFSIAVGDAEADTVMLDAAVPYVATRNRRDDFAYSTNLYLAPGLEEADMRRAAKRHVCVYRGGYLRWVAETQPPKSLDDVKALLASHEPWAPCRHDGPHGSVTTWSMICLPQDRKILVADGNPCASEYVEYGFCHPKL
jgi:hypothetical protein